MNSTEMMKNVYHNANEKELEQWGILTYDEQVEYNEYLKSQINLKEQLLNQLMTLQ